MINHYYTSDPNFFADIKVREGVRRHPFRNGIRWSFVIKDEADMFETWGVAGPSHRDIFPVFLENGQPIPPDIDLFSGEYHAAMFVLTRDNPENSKLKIGRKFYLCEGARIMADGLILTVPTGLTME